MAFGSRLSAFGRAASSEQFAHSPTPKARSLLALALCFSAATGLSAITLVSVSDEIAIGKQAQAQVRKEVPVLHDSQVAAYVSDIGRRLSAAAPGPKYPYTFSVADYKEINAFALPGGPVWINRGVLRAATNESQVAAVLAHEIAHVAQRHAADQLTKTMVARWGLGLLGAVLGNSGGAMGAQAAAALLANGIFMKFSRDDEADADRVGLRILVRAGWDARGMMEMFEILRRESQRNPGAVAAFFASHPSPEDRIQAIRATVVTRRPAGRRNSARFQTIARRVRALPPAHSMAKP